MSTTPSVTTEERVPAFASVVPQGPRVRELNHPPSPVGYFLAPRARHGLSLSSFPRVIESASETDIHQKNILENLRPQII